MPPFGRSSNIYHCPMNHAVSESSLKIITTNMSRNERPERRQSASSLDDSRRRNNNNCNNLLPLPEKAVAVDDTDYHRHTRNPSRRWSDVVFPRKYHYRMKAKEFDQECSLYSKSLLGSSIQPKLLPQPKPQHNRVLVEKQTSSSSSSSSSSLLGQGNQSARPGVKKSALRVKTHEESINRTGIVSSYQPQNNENNGAGQPPKQLSNKKLTWSDLEFHNHEIVLDVNPAVSCGPPIGIGWNVLSSHRCSIDEYERLRPPRRQHQQLAMPRMVREMMLTEQGYGRSDWQAMEQEIRRIQNSRRGNAEAGPWEKTVRFLVPKLMVRSEAKIGSSTSSNLVS